MFSKLQVWVLGASLCGKNTFLKAVHDTYGSTSTTKTKKSSQSPASQNNSHSTPITLDLPSGKYDVTFKISYDTGFTIEEQQEISGADGFLIMYDITNKFSLERLRLYHKKILTLRKAQTAPIVIIGNKCDVSNEDRQISAQDALKIADSCKSPLLEVSATKVKNIDAVFKELINLIVAEKKQQVLQDPTAFQAMLQPKSRSSSLSRTIPIFVSVEESAKQDDAYQARLALQRRRAKSQHVNAANAAANATVDNAAVSPMQDKSPQQAYAQQELPASPAMSPTKANAQ